MFSERARFFGLGLSAVTAMGVANSAQGMSLLNSRLSEVGGGGPATFTLNDDDQARFVDLTGDGPDTTVNGVGGVEALATGDQIVGFIDFPSFDFAGVGTELSFNGFEVTGTYTLTVGTIADNPVGTGQLAGLTGTVSFFEDASDNASFGTDSTFSDGDFLGTFNLTGSLTAPFADGGIGSTLAGIIPDGTTSGSSVNLSGGLDLLAGGFFTDPTLFDNVGPAGFTFQIEGPQSGFDFGSDGGVLLTANVVPSPAAFGIGLIGAGVLGLRRRRNAGQMAG